MSNALKVTLQRDGVCQADDIYAPHQESIHVPQDCTLAQALDGIRQKRYLASISGGYATWIVESNRPLAVMAEQ